MTIYSVSQNSKSFYQSGQEIFNDASRTMCDVAALVTKCASNCFLGIGYTVTAVGVLLLKPMITFGPGIDGLIVSQLVGTAFAGVGAIMHYIANFFVRYGDKSPEFARFIRS